MASFPWNHLAAAAILAVACSSEPDSPGTNAAGNPGTGGASAAGTGGAGAAGAGGAGAAGTGGAGAAGAGGAGAVAGTGGAESSATAGGGGAAGGVAYVCPSLGDPCSTCLSLRCQETYCACLQNPECTALDNCLLGCPERDEPCRRQCLLAHGEGISDSFLVDGCASEHCSAQCRSRSALSACESCLFVECAAPRNACIASPACRALLACDARCGTGGAERAACREACVSAHTGGADLAEPVFACEGATCERACAPR